MAGCEAGNGQHIHKSFASSVPGSEISRPKCQSRIGRVDFPIPNHDHSRADDNEVDHLKSGSLLTEVTHSHHFVWLLSFVG